MISAYRLGDLYAIGLSADEVSEILDQHPESIGAEYAIANPELRSRIDIVSSIAWRRASKYARMLPEDIDTSTVIHLRLGDVVAGTEYHERCKRPLSVEHLRRTVPSTADKTYIIGKCFFAAPSSTNYDECIRTSTQYLDDVLRDLNAEHFDGGTADADLCCAIKCKRFVQGRGYFSQLIVDIRKHMSAVTGLEWENVETVAELPPE